MSMDRTQNPSDAWAALKSQVARGKPQPEHPQRLPLRSIKLRPEVFQQRKPARHHSEAHVRELSKSIAATSEGTLDPITVWWDGRGWTCLDGHHRSAAYRKASKADAVPVAVFEGTPDEALAFSARSNTKDKLAMSRSEKSNAAWRLVVLSEMSKSDIAEATGVSQRNVANMRTTKRHLQALADAFDPFGVDAGPVYADDLGALTWDAARRLAAGEDVQHSFDEDARVQELASKLRKALGPTAERQPVVFARAVEVYSPMLAKALQEYFEVTEEAPEDA